MKTYTIYYVEKRNRAELLKKMEVEAKTAAAAAAEAKKICKERFYEKTKKNAFRPQTSVKAHMWNKDDTERIAKIEAEIEKDGYSIIGHY